MNRNLMNRRTPKIRVQTISIGSGIFQQDPGNPEHPTVNFATAPAKLEEFQASPPQDVDPKRS